jgi:hypothetical protein
VNIAKNKTTALSSTWKDETTSERAVDGNTDNLIAGESCAVTGRQNNPWFQLDLQKSTEVNKNSTNNSGYVNYTLIARFQVYVECVRAPECFQGILEPL